MLTLRAGRHGVADHWDHACSHTVVASLGLLVDRVDQSRWRPEVVVVDADLDCVASTHQHPGRDVDCVDHRPAFAPRYQGLAVHVNEEHSGACQLQTQALSRTGGVHLDLVAAHRPF